MRGPYTISAIGSTFRHAGGHMPPNVAGRSPPSYSSECCSRGKPQRYHTASRTQRGSRGSFISFTSNQRGQQPYQTLESSVEAIASQARAHAGLADGPRDDHEVAVAEAFDAGDAAALGHDIRTASLRHGFARVSLGAWAACAELAAAWQRQQLGRQAAAAICWLGTAAAAVACSPARSVLWRAMGIGTCLVVPVVLCGATGFMCDLGHYASVQLARWHAVQLLWRRLCA